MNLNRFTRLWTNALTFFVVASGALVVCSLELNGQERGAERLLQSTEKPDRETPEPVESHRKDEANKTLRERERLRAKASRAEAESARGDQERKEQLTKLQRELEEFRGKLKELRGERKADEAAEVEQHIRNLQQELERRKEEFRAADRERRLDRRSPIERRGRFERERMEPQPPGDGRQPPTGMTEAERRLHHLQAAIDNLHAAGLHEPAEHLAQEARRMREQLQAGPPPRPESGMRPGGRPPQTELEPMREEIRKLHEAVQDLRRRVEELSRERR
jgi:HAMP domain-containing protein